MAVCVGVADGVEVEVGAGVGEEISVTEAVDVGLAVSVKALSPNSSEVLLGKNMNPKRRSIITATTTPAKITGLRFP